MEMVSSTRADIQNWLEWNENIGVMGLHIFGFPGSGKSNLANILISYCLEQGDMILTRGSMNCEWRHFSKILDYKIKILIPEELAGDKGIKFHGFELKDHDHEYFKPEEFKIMDHLERGEILVIYDAAFDLASRGWFWAGIFQQLIRRTEKCDAPVTYLDHEAGILFPEIALSGSKDAQNHWKAVNKITELFVDFRKNLVRPILLSQLPSEINHRLRDKCLFTIIKQGVAGKHYPEQVREEAPQQLVNQFISSIGKGPYIRWNTSEKFKEIKKMWKMVPQKELSLFVEEIAVKLPTHICGHCGWKWVAKVKEPKSCPSCRMYGKVFSTKFDEIEEIFDEDETIVSLSH